MFSRRPDRPREEPRYAPPSTSTRPSDLLAVPPSDQPPGVWGASPVAAGSPSGSLSVPTGPNAGEATVIAANDHVEGVLRSGQGVLIEGSYTGTIESESWIRIADGATVMADLTAQEIMVAGRFSGRIVARVRLEIGATGSIQGDIETPRLQLHEGGLIDGALSMTRKDPGRVGAAGAAPAAGASPAPAAGAPAPATRASVRSGGGPSGSPRERGATPVPVETPAMPEVPAASRPAAADEPAEVSTRPLKASTGP